MEYVVLRELLYVNEQQQQQEQQQTHCQKATATRCSAPFYHIPETS
jgi:hypothetical protein